MKTPSLNINLTDKCNFNCIYCPQYGESLEKAENLCDIKSILMLIQTARDVGINVLRLTGGEPLLEPKRVFSFIEEAVKYNYKKIILNTNGLLLNKYYNELLKFKDFITLKISIDSLNERTFKLLTKSDKFNIVYSNLIQYTKAGFRIGINTVVTKYNTHEAIDLIKFGDINKIDVKFLGVSDFGGNVSNSDFRVSFSQFVRETTKIFENVVYEKLIGGVGITMPTIKLTESNVFFVDHENDNISNKLYSAQCKTKCKYYPCETGLLHIALAANGKLRYCRLLTNDYYNINNCKSYDVLRDILKEYINKFN